MYKYPQLYEGVLIKRYKRFFADIEIVNPKGSKEVITAHNPNTGSMRSLLIYPVKALYSTSDNSKRKLKYSLEFLQAGRNWVMTNTIAANRIVELAINDGELAEFQSPQEIKREYSYLDSKIDFFILNEGLKYLLEVKSVTYFDEDSAYFPDAKTERGRKHLNTLINSINDGYKPVMLYLLEVDRDQFSPAENIDPEYAAEYYRAKEAGVMMLFYYNCYDPSTNSTYLVKKEINT